ncbi:type IV secretory system conjugative DNA transfer family protein [Actinomycetospora flava]|uniref:TraM recognition domain-containing protein n=1 Tax=Actinomycetospora flava TaxID=3129232 RepID=A0ABU8MFS8_9PSEU
MMSARTNFEAWQSRVTSDAQRHGPRALRLTVVVWLNITGACRALLLRVRLWARPLVAAMLASTRWARVAIWIAERARARRVVLCALLAGLLAWLVGPTSGLGLILAVPALAWAGVLAGVGVYPHTARGRVRTRYGLDGWAGFWDLYRHLSAHAVRQTTATMRVSVTKTLPARIDTPEDVDDAGGPGCAAAVLARRARLVERLPITECGTWLGRSSVGPVVGLECYAAHRDVVGLVAPPQTGKSALMGHHILDHPGAVVSTSTKAELYRSTAALRAKVARSGRVELFNPEDLGGLGSTFRWAPVHGCWSPSVAAERAAALVGATSAAGGEDGTFWLDSAAKVLRCFLMAAALDDRSMRDVASWVTSPTDEADDALQLLEDTYRDHVPPGWAGELRQVLKTPAQRTRESIFLTLSQSVAFMADPAVADTCCVAPDEPVFDVAAFVADRGTLYMLGSERQHSTIAPLLAALTGHIFDSAKALAATYPRERLDPPMMLNLDEAALIVPVPLDRWVADAGGRGIHIVWSIQSPSQLAQRWGERGAQTILNATNATLFYGGLKLDADLDAVSKLCGTRLELVPDPDDDGAGHARYERVPVCPPDRVRTLPQWHALLVHRATPATIVRIFPAWERADVRAAATPLAVPSIRDVFADEDTSSVDVPGQRGQIVAAGGR